LVRYLQMRPHFEESNGCLHKKLRTAEFESSQSRSLYIYTNNKKKAGSSQLLHAHEGDIIGRRVHQRRLQETNAIGIEI
jgi:hypothetical protein